MLCLSLAAADVGALPAQARAHAAHADLIELRFDALADVSPAALAAARVALRTALPGPLIHTLRAPGEGGRAPALAPPTRIAAARAALAAGYDWADVEEDVFAAVAAHTGADRLILSVHLPETPAPTLPALLAVRQRLAAYRPGIVKLAWPAADAVEAFALAQARAASDPPLLLAPQGPAGECARLLYRLLGAPWTYAAPDAAHATGAGQPTIAALAGEWRARAVGPDTRAFGVIGRPVAGSWSPALYRRLFAAAGLDAVCTRFDTADPAALLDLLAVYPVAGLAVTMPHKSAVLRVPDIAADEDCRAAGAANTLVRTAAARDGDRLPSGCPSAPPANDDHTAPARWRAHHFDGIGAWQALGRPRGRRVLILGAGGAARAAALACRAAGNEVALCARSEDGRRAARALGCAALAPAELPAAHTDLLIQATPAGRDGSPTLPFEGRALPLCTRALEMVTTPVETPLLRLMRARGIDVVPGWVMLGRQAVAQYAAFTGQRITWSRVRRVLAELAATREAEQEPRA